MTMEFNGRGQRRNHSVENEYEGFLLYLSSATIYFVYVCGLRVVE